MYRIPKEEDLGPEYLGRLLPMFQTKDLPKLNRAKKYYDGKQKIMQKIQQEGKPCNRIVVNYCYNIVNEYNGYITGIPITYENDDEGFTPIIDVLNYNDVESEDSEYLKNCLIYGVAYEVNYVDSEGQQRFRLFDSRECVPVYSDTLEDELLYVVRFYRENILEKDDTKYLVEVYGPNDIKTYQSSMGWASFNLIKVEPHYYGQCPVTVFKAPDEAPIFSQIMALQDGYNNLMSDIVDDEDSFADAYLVLKGLTAEEEDLAKMKTNKVLMMDTDADASFLTKDLANSTTQQTLQTFNDQIYHISACPDFSDEKFLAQSGIALKYKLLSFENMASNIEKQMKKALQRRLELIQAIFSITDDAPWQECNIKFVRNLPISLEPTTPDELMSYRGLVSNYTLLSLLPFIKDPDEELKIKEEEDSLELFQVEEDEDNGLLETENLKGTESN